MPITTPTVVKTAAAGSGSGSGSLPLKTWWLTASPQTYRKRLIASCTVPHRHHKKVLGPIHHLTTAVSGHTHQQQDAGFLPPQGLKLKSEQFPFSWRQRQLPPLLLEKWLSEAQLQDTYNDDSIHHQPALIEQQSISSSSTSSPFNPSEHLLHLLTDEQLHEHCHNIGYKGTKEEADTLLEHFERQRKTAGKQSDTDQARVRTRQLTHRRQIAVQALLIGLAQRDIHCNDLRSEQTSTEDATPIKGKRVSNPVRRSLRRSNKYTSHPSHPRFAEQAGLEVLIPPSQLLRIHALLCGDNSESQPTPPYSRIPPSLCFVLATRIAISQRQQLFPIFVSLMQRLQQSKPQWETTHKDPRELVFILQYLLQSWKQGGSRIGQDIFHLLLSRPEDVKSITQIENDAKTWLPDESDKNVLIHLFAHLLLFRYSLLAGLPLQAKAACRDVLLNFPPGQEDVAGRFICNTCSGLLNPQPSSSTPQAQFAFESVQELLSEHIHLVAGSQQIGQVIKSFCRYAVQFRKPRTAFDLLRRLTENNHSTTLDALITGPMLIKLLEETPAESAQSSSSLISSLLGTTEIDTLPKQPMLLDVAHTLRRPLVEALCQSGLKRTGASLYLYWIHKDEANRHALLTDAGMMVSLVRSFSRPSQQASLPSEDVSGRSLFARRGAPYSVQEGHEFSKEVIQAFRDEKPLKDCNHYDLTSLASAYFYTGQDTLGFRMFRRLLQQRHVPDDADLVVLMKAIASADVSRATQLYLSSVGWGKWEDVSDGVPSFIRGIRGNPQILAILLERAFEVSDASTIKQLLRHTESKDFSINKSTPEGVSLAFTLEIVKMCWTSRDWSAVVERVQEWYAGRKHHRPWQPSHIIMTTLVEASINDMSTKGYLARRRERVEYHSAPESERDEMTLKYKYSSPSTTPLYTHPQLRLPMGALNAAVSMLETLESSTKSTRMGTVDLFLHRLHIHCQCPRRKNRNILSREIDRVVTVLTRMESRIGCSSPLSPHPHVSSEGRTMLNPIIFRSLIFFYLSIQDIQGASEIFLWMKTWFRLGYFRKHSDRNDSDRITGKDMVRIGLGTKLVNRIAEILGMEESEAVEMLSRDEDRGWGFESKRIEKTKDWWITE
ncbi:unnamed protein product [Sympodiomycopsis kandeliae]